MLRKLIILAFSFFLFSCREKKETSEESNIYFTCSMDPQVMETKPGTCPICKMPLTPVTKESNAQANELTLSEQQIQLGNITEDTVRQKALSDVVSLAGKVAVNANTAFDISSRVMGRIEKLYFKSTGETVAAGAPLYDIYSEELNLAVNEFLLAKDKKRVITDNSINHERLIKSAKEKLLIYGLTERQIDTLTIGSIRNNTVTILSNAEGIIHTVKVEEGSYVDEGSSILQIINLATVWVETEVFSENIKEISDGMNVRVLFPGMPDIEYTGKISFVSPELSSSTLINLARVEIKNSDFKIRPGMQALALVSKEDFSAIALPINAVLRTGKRAVVWIKAGDKKYKRIMVSVGRETDGFLEIIDGLKAGDIAVVTGAYLLNSEYVFKKGSDAMEGHSH